MNELNIPATKTTALAAMKVACENRMDRAVCLVGKDGRSLYIEHARINKDAQVEITILTGNRTDDDGNPLDTETYTVDPQRPVTVTVKQHFWNLQTHYRNPAKRVAFVRQGILDELAKRHQVYMNR